MEGKAAQYTSLLSQATQLQERYRQLKTKHAQTEADLAKVWGRFPKV